MPVYDVAIVGGGNLGLWTAYRLARRFRARGGPGAGLGRWWGDEPFGWGGSPAGRLGDGGDAGPAREGAVPGAGRGARVGSGVHETGYYIVAETEEEKESFLRLVEVRREAGVENEWVEPEEGKERFPDLDGTVSWVPLTPRPTGT